MPNYKFVESEEDLLRNIHELYKYELQWREVVGNAPKYFVHSKINSENRFGLSKFSAFKDITVEDYLAKYRYEIGGGTTQNHIRYITNKEWIPFDELPVNEQNSFSNWIHSFFPNYNLSNSAFITISDKGKKPESKKRKKRKLSPEELEEKLEIQNKIGAIGELIAVEYEKNRLLNLGFKESEFSIEHVALENVSKGFDILSNAKGEERCIEVKSSITNNEFYISENEKNVLEDLEDKAFIYLVKISNFEKEEGRVIKEIQNPIPKLKDKFRTVLYRVKVN